MNLCSKSENSRSDLTPEMTIPLLPNGTVVLGDNSVKYCANSELTMPVQLPIQECNHDDSKCGKIYCFNTSPNRPCSIPVYPANAPQYSSSFVQQPNSYVCLYVPTEKN